MKVEATILKNCKTEPTPIDYRCEFDGTFSEGAWPVPFEEGDMYVGISRVNYSSTDRNLALYN